jgi:hypothetical protein
MMPVLKVLDELDHADDGDNQWQPHVVTDWADLQLPVEDKCEDHQTYQEIHASRCRHSLDASSGHFG